jgi:Mg/Co/Ni transporter MgtE
MQVRPILQAEALTRLLQGAVLGAVATMVIGFDWGGWTLASTASQMADDRASAAVVAVLAPIYVDKFQRQDDAAWLSNIDHRFDCGDLFQRRVIHYGTHKAQSGC